MDNLEKYYQKIIDDRYYINKKRLKYKLNYLFKGIDFKDKNVLDIGGGIGIFSFFAACRGAKNVICLEPELDGSTIGLYEKFNSIKNYLQLNNVDFINATFQEYKFNMIFDVVISHDSINHLDEEACNKIKKNMTSKKKYIDIFLKLNQITSPNSKIIICDCSDKSFFSLIHIKNPFAYSIEWEKHQSPEIWVSLLEETGFRKESIRWSSPNRFGKFGKYLMGNRIVSYFINSHFCLSLIKM